jgi:hypothetical protein
VTGFNFGLGVNIKLSNSLYLVPEFKAISSKGFENTSSLVTGDESIDDQFKNVRTVHKLNYIDLPVLLHYRLHNRFQIGLGPQVCFLTNASEKYYNTTGAFDQDIKESLNKTDAGIAANLTYILSSSRNGKSLNFQFRYYKGFTNVFPDSGQNNNSVFSFNVEFPFINDEAAAK